MLDNIKSQMRKGMLEYCILIILNKEALYATEIIRQLKAVELIVVEGTLYPILTRLKNAEILSYYWEESTQGPPRKYFKITEKGENLLMELKKEWELLSHVTNQLNK